MASLVVRDIDDEIVKALKTKASLEGISAEAMHRIILQKALLAPKKRSFEEVLKSIPPVGKDEDFERRQDGGSANIFD